MFKKIILAVATFAFIAVAYTIYQWQDDTFTHQERKTTKVVPRRKPTIRSGTTQPVGSSNIQSKALSFKDANIPPGKSPKISIFDKKGREKIRFRSTEWSPVSDKEFHLVEPTARIILPGGQVAYVRADEGQVIVQRGDSDNYNPKSGWLRGHVRIFIDRTTPQWRADHMDLAEPDQHPESIVKIWLDDVQFDLDMAWLKSKGPIILQSPDGTIEGKGLKLVWNEINRQIKLLRIDEGKRATVRSSALVGFDFTSGVQVVRKADGDVPSSTQPAKVSGKENVAELAKTKTETAKGTESLEFIEPGEKPTKPKPDRIDTYQVEFKDNIIAKQLDGAWVKGQLKADILRMIRDFSRSERSTIEYVSVDDSTTNAKKSSETAPADQEKATESRTTIELVWSGEMEITPVETRQGDQKATGNRFHITAIGNPVEIIDRKGKARCGELVYHDETKRVWLKQGTADKLVMMRAGKHRQLMGEEIFLDRKVGVAQVKGSGKIIDQVSNLEDQWLGDYVKADSDSTDTDKDERNKLEITWNRNVEIEFGLAKTESSTSTPDPDSPLPEGIYIKHVTFEGNASFALPGKSITADRIEATFLEPYTIPGVSPDSTLADTIRATGKVRMKQDRSRVECGRLEVQMTVNDVGQNVPEIGRAFEKVMVRNQVRKGKARAGNQRVEFIRAQDELTIYLASVPDPVTPEEEAKYRAAAKEQKIDPGSPKWDAFERKLRNRRKIELTRLDAKGEVGVFSAENTLWGIRERFNLASDSLNCSFAEDNSIKRALIVGRDEEPAQVAMDDFYIEGPQISLDMIAESVEVPGSGILQFYTEQDLDGRKVDDPVPVTVTWDKQMFLRGQSNDGCFTGNVRAVSENNVLNCRRELRIEFEDLPKEPEVTLSSTPDSDSKGGIGTMLDWFKPKKEPSVTSRFTKKIRKRPVWLHAVGDAVILSSDYKEGKQQTGGAVSRMLGSMLLASNKDTNTQTDDTRQRQLVSRVRVAGPRIAIDLANEYMNVEGTGNLQIEDYRLPKTRKSGSFRSSSLLGGSSFSNLQNTRLSQTQFRWQNSMSFFNDRNLAVFDHQVEMIHLSGSQMVLSKELESALGVDASKLENITGRNADMTCDNLLVQFGRDDQRSNKGPSLLSRATQLKAFWATGRISMRETNRSVQGNLASYNEDTALIRISGSSQQPAQIIELDKDSGALRAQCTGEVIEWNLKTGTYRAIEPRILATGK
ncbi:MAG: hypothetical protein JSV03_10255 [Planctomycetota bacterium]|nr:MAG: hypothetical protein JSV03_10255 [Planctomycetota bacterium]